MHPVGPLEVTVEGSVSTSATGGTQMLLGGGASFRLNQNQPLALALQSLNITGTGTSLRGRALSINVSQDVLVGSCASVNADYLGHAGGSPGYADASGGASAGGNGALAGSGGGHGGRGLPGLSALSTEALFDRPFPAPNVSWAEVWESGLSLDDLASARAALSGGGTHGSLHAPVSWGGGGGSSALSPGAAATAAAASPWQCSGG